MSLSSNLRVLGPAGMASRWPAGPGAAPRRALCTLGVLGLVGQTSTSASHHAGLATPDGVKLILGGRTLQPDDGGKTLHECGVTAASRVLVVAGAQAGTQLQQQEAKVQRLEKVRDAVGGLRATRALRLCTCAAALCLRCLHSGKH